MASGTKNKGSAKARAAKSSSSIVAAKPTPWGTIIGILIVLLVGGVVIGYGVYANVQAKHKQEALDKYKPSESDKDPSSLISGVVKVDNLKRSHISAEQRVAYDQSPPFGGPHDSSWAECNGDVYQSAVRNENMVHGLEHGAIWIAYNPDKIKGNDLAALSAKVDSQAFMMMSPYPGLDHPVSLQAWGHQLKLDDPKDARIDQFVQALRRNPYVTPEISASCDVGTGSTFDPKNPPPYDPSKPGAGAIPMSGEGAAAAGSQPTAPAAPVAPPK
jgi:hypothetical protein